MTEPLLRSPPFPWVDAKIAQVSARSAGTGPPSDPERLGSLITAIRMARIGGEFWRPGMSTEAVVIRDEDVPAGVDLWSLFRPGITLITTSIGETALIAALAGATVDGVDQAEMLTALDAAIVRNVAYRDCFTGAPCAAERVIDILGGWRRTIDANRDIVAMTGVSWWKKQTIGRFLWADRDPALATSDDMAAIVAAAAGRGAIALWPSRAPTGLYAAAAAANIPIVAIEDGFVRSVGLGSDLHVPRSIVVDGGGIYYDPSRPSDLESLLATADFPPVLIDRARALRRRIVDGGISKYASDGQANSMTVPPRARRTVLVAGQVEDDMSVRAAGGDVAGNLDLLRRARAIEPDAHLIFKPHPDVDAGHRVGRIADGDMAGLADEVVRAGSMAALLSRVDAVHVLTSQTGFEALLRGIETIVHGQPFYAGWGLTTDLARPLPRRGRALTIDQLVAATLILYPRYLDLETELPCPPETLIDRFSERSRPRRSPLIFMRQIQGRLAKLMGTVTS